MPDAGDLSDIERRSQQVLRDLVEEAGGRFAGSYIKEDHLGLLSFLFDTLGAPARGRD